MKKKIFDIPFLKFIFIFFWWFVVPYNKLFAQNCNDAIQVRVEFINQNPITKLFWVFGAEELWVRVVVKNIGANDVQLEPIILYYTLNLWIENESGENLDLNASPPYNISPSIDENYFQKLKPGEELKYETDLFRYNHILESGSKEYQFKKGSWYLIKGYYYASNTNLFNGNGCLILGKFSINSLKFIY